MRSKSTLIKTKFWRYTMKLYTTFASTLALTLALGSGISIAGEASDRWNMSEARQQRIEAKAAELGLDLSTEEGKTAFKEYHQEQSEIKAAELGIDLSTEEGKAAFREARQEMRSERREARQAVRAQIAELSDEERTALRDELQELSREERRAIIKERFGS
jgi:hypothetical protein